MKTCKATVRDSNSSSAKATRLITDELADIAPTKLPDSLTVKLNDLRTARDDASEHFKQAGEEFQGATKELRGVATGASGSARNWWGGLSGRGKTITIAAVGGFLLLGAFSEKEEDNNDKDRPVATAETPTSSTSSYRSPPSSYRTPETNGDKYDRMGDRMIDRMRKLGSLTTEAERNARKLMDAYRERDM